jgi:hypothetical protein
MRIIFLSLLFIHTVLCSTSLRADKKGDKVDENIDSTVLGRVLRDELQVNYEKMKKYVYICVTSGCLSFAAKWIRYENLSTEMTETTGSIDILDQMIRGLAVMLYIGIQLSNMCLLPAILLSTLVAIYVSVYKPILEVFHKQ